MAIWNSMSVCETDRERERERVWETGLANSVTWYVTRTVLSSWPPDLLLKDQVSWKVGNKFPFYASQFVCSVWATLKSDSRRMFTQASEIRGWWWIIGRGAQNLNSYPYIHVQQPLTRDFTFETLIFMQFICYFLSVHMLCSCEIWYLVD